MKHYPTSSIQLAIKVPLLSYYNETIDTNIIVIFVVIKNNLISFRLMQNKLNKAVNNKIIITN